MPEKWKRCIGHVKASNAGKPAAKRVNPYAVCTASTGQHAEKKKKPGR